MTLKFGDLPRVCLVRELPDRSLPLALETQTIRRGPSSNLHSSISTIYLASQASQQHPQASAAASSPSKHSFSVHCSKPDPLVCACLSSIGVYNSIKFEF
ncbi:hypothetical protein POPTR_018G073125v4 [Populus trichocarpa]|uniref:Uncharacterized protein n=1 Tax=Populus trichocarpa TaxID=3694 RepID=A0ACC0RM05_POPTR|nr:hypothetical protein POPTR_018G073125v4 [Populus trichocarpa]